MQRRRHRTLAQIRKRGIPIGLALGITLLALLLALLAAPVASASPGQTAEVQGNVHAALPADTPGPGTPVSTFSPPVIATPNALTPTAASPDHDRSSDTAANHHGSDHSSDHGSNSVPPRER